MINIDIFVIAVFVTSFIFTVINPTENVENNENYKHIMIMTVSGIQCHNDKSLTLKLINYIFYLFK